MTSQQAFGMGVAVTAGLLSFTVHFVHGDKSKVILGGSCLVTCLVGVLITAFG